jgi:hypothetical protein
VKRGEPGTQRRVDDDGDGRIDEEILNGRDDDGDREVDEDLGIPGDQMMASDFTDDQPEAVNFVYSTGEQHVPLGLSVHHEAYAWNAPGYDGTAGLHFRITNHGHARLRQVHVGLLVDLDARVRSDLTGHVNDRVVHETARRSIGLGTSVITVGSNPSVTRCIAVLERPVAVIRDGVAGSRLPAAAVLPLEHTIDPLEWTPGRAFARAPGAVSFRVSTFESKGQPGRGGLPILDPERYEALAGRWRSASASRPDDYATLVACGPFEYLDPVQSIEFTVALVAAESATELEQALANALYLHHGVALNLMPDTIASQREQWLAGATGTFGHEVCVEPPPGVTFVMDAHCASKFAALAPTPTEVTYRNGQCVWTDADCDPCTGLRGAETIERWLDPARSPPAPRVRAVPRDHRVRIEWDNLPEVMVGAGQLGPQGSVFLGYRLYKLADWRGRSAALPPRDNWALLRHEVHNGFDYVYAVTSVYERRDPGYAGGILATRLESPLEASLETRVTPQLSARADASRVWVVPNPYRANAPWERPPVGGDPLTRHIAFMGLPNVACTIKIWTVAGDLVAEIRHDGADGQASWNLISRNGQDVESGVYLFSIESSAGRAVARFVVIR